MRYTRWLALALFVIAIVTGTVALLKSPPTVKTAWSTVAQRCAESDLDGDTTLFFGPSNSLGPGSIWRLAGASTGGGYRVRWRDQAVPGARTWSLPGRAFSCEGMDAIKLSGEAVGQFSADILPVSGQMQTDLALARQVEFRTASMRWDEVLEGPFEEAVAKLPSGNPVKEDLSKPGRLVLYRALKVYGFEAVLTFDAPVAEKLRARYHSHVVLPGHDTLSANLTWTSRSELRVTVPSGFYVAGQLVPFNAEQGFCPTPGYGKTCKDKIAPRQANG